MGGSANGGPMCFPYFGCPGPAGKSSGKTVKVN